MDHRASGAGPLGLYGHRANGPVAQLGLLGIMDYKGGEAAYMANMPNKTKNEKKKQKQKQKAKTRL